MPILTENDVLAKLTNDVFTAIAESKAAATYLPSYQAEMPTRTLRLLGMGQAIATWLDHNGEDIATVFLVALEQADCHDWVVDIEKATGVSLVETYAQKQNTR